MDKHLEMYGNLVKLLINSLNIYQTISVVPEA